MPGTKDHAELIESSKKHLIHYLRYQIPESIFVKGEGVYLWDLTGRRYIDFKSQATSANVGYRNRRIEEAIKLQVQELSQLSSDSLSIPAIRLAKLMSQISPTGLTRFYFTCSGSEATEIAIKTVRRFTNRQKIVCLWGGYHGGTLAALSASGIASAKRRFDPGLPGFLHVPAPYCYRCVFGLEYPECQLRCAEAICDAITYEGPETVAAVFMEPVIGGGGVIVPPDDYLPRVRNICNELGVLLILDEVVTGFGRTGKMFCSQHYNVSPDMMVFGKGVTSSYLPLGGLAVTEKIAGQIDSWPEQGTHMFTHANHPLVCASAIANIQVLIEENMVQNSERMGTYLLDRLNELSVENEHIDGIRGKGLFVGAEIVKSKHTREEDQDLGHRVAERAREKGLLFVLSQLRMANATIAIFSPPLSISSDQIDEGLEIFRSALKETSA